MSAVRCVHCARGSTAAELTDDHILPDAWYPGRIPRSQRPVVPSCKDCNGKLGQIEQRVFEKIALCLSPGDPRFGDVAQRAGRAYRPTAARNERDRKARARARARIVRELDLARQVLQTEQGRRSVLRLSDTTPSHEYPPEERSVRLLAEDLHEVWRKMVRGLAWHLGGVLLSRTDDLIKVWNEGECDPSEFDRLLATNAHPLIVEDVLEAHWRATSDRPSAAILSVAIWASQVRWWAAITPACASPASDSDHPKEDS